MTNGESELDGWREVMREIDYNVKQAEDSAREFPGGMNRGMRDAWMYVQEKMVGNLTRQMTNLEKTGGKKDQNRHDYLD